MVAQPQVVMTPHVTTPMIYQQASPPWVTQTPESSPMLWGCAPSNEGYYVQPEVPMGQLVSKEVLRSVCEPYFDQMLIAVQQALQTQAQPAQQGHAQSWQQMPYSSTCQQEQGFSTEEPSTEEGSDIVSEGAFSTIFSQSAQSGRVADEEKSVPIEYNSQTKASDESEDVEAHCSLVAEVQYEELASEPPLGSDQVQSAMVCRHWKSKGFCRMEDNCKFLHPEHKRGVGPVSGTAGGMGGDAIVDTSLIVDDVLDIKKKSPAKRRKNKSKTGVFKEDMSGLPFVGDP